ncbi:MAG: hypothetical protein Q4C83_00160 [Candidatus Saccharibacteria bacterium]|nr:hypothetical protein [Candidatus Saccharibacteria bacterium]
MKKVAVKSLVAGLAVLSIQMIVPTAAFALSLPDVFSGPYRGNGQPADLFNGADAIIPRVINLMLFIVGVLAIFMIIYGGIRYVLSGGDNSKVKDAKNTILYAIVGLIVAILGYAIVNWVVSVIGSGGTVGESTTVGLITSSLL